MYRLGVDLGGTNIVVGLVDETMKIVDKVSCKTNLPRAAKSIIEDIARLCNKVVEENRIDAEDVEAVGVGAGRSPCYGKCVTMSLAGLRQRMKMMQELLALLCWGWNSCAQRMRRLAMRVIRRHYVIQKCTSLFGQALCEGGYFRERWYCYGNLQRG